MLSLASSLPGSSSHSYTHHQSGFTYARVEQLLVWRLAECKFYINPPRWFRFLSHLWRSGYNSLLQTSMASHSIHLWPMLHKSPYSCVMSFDPAYWLESSCRTTIMQDVSNDTDFTKCLQDTCKPKIDRPALSPVVRSSGSLDCDANPAHLRTVGQCVPLF